MTRAIISNSNSQIVAKYKTLDFRRGYAVEVSRIHFLKYLKERVQAMKKIVQNTNLEQVTENVTNYYAQLNEQRIPSDLKISISRSNQKMGTIPSLSFPPLLTCADECKELCGKKCYAVKMCKRRKSILNAWWKNYWIWENFPQTFRKQLIGEAITASYFRYFVGGDIPNLEFLEMMVEIAEECPNTQFLAFTKRIALVNGYIAWYGKGKIPANLHLILSEWNKPIDNPFELPKSKIIFDWQEEPKNSKICGGNCVSCVCKGIGCWELKDGETIYFHEH